MYELISIDFKNNFKLITSSFFIIILSNYIVRSNILNYIIFYYVTLGIVLDIESKSIKDKSLFYFNMFPKMRGYVIIEKIIFGFFLSIIFYSLTNLINYIISLNIIKPYTLIHLFNVILISGILSIKVKVYNLRVYTNIITIIYGLTITTVNKFNFRFPIKFDFFSVLFFFLLIYRLICRIRKTDYFYNKSL